MTFGRNLGNNDQLERNGLKQHDILGFPTPFKESILEFSIKSGSPEKQRTACVVLGVFEPRKLSSAAEVVDHEDAVLAGIRRHQCVGGQCGAEVTDHALRQDGNGV